MKIKSIVNIISIISIIFTALFLLGCSKPSEPNILAKSLQAHGGQNWDKVRNIAFTKTIVVFDSPSNLTNLANPTSKVVQQQTIHFNPFRMRVVWNKLGLKSEIVWEADSFVLYKNGRAISDGLALSAAENNIKAAFFAFWLPKKFVDPKAQLADLGIKLVNNTKVHVLKITYLNSEDIWHVFFDTETFMNLGYSVWHNDNWSLIWNEEFQSYQGIALVSKRKSYKSDSLYQLKYVQADYLYELKE